MDNAIIDVAHREELDAVFGNIARQRFQLVARFRILHAGEAGGLVLGRRVVVGHSEGQVGAAHAAARRLQAGKGLRGGHLMDQVQVDIKKAFPRRLIGVHQMRIPDLVVECLACHGPKIPCL
jgi:hypothetical protein